MRAARTCTIFALLLWASAALAQAPPLIPIQGSLFDEAGVPIDDTVSMDFTLYDDDVGTNVLHQEAVDVDVVDGFFTVYLGAGEVPCDLATFAANPTVFLGVAVGEDPEMDLVEIATAPYAAYCDVAGEAATLEGQSVTQLRTVDPCTEGNAIRVINTDGTVTCEPVGAGAHTHDVDDIDEGVFPPARIDAYGDLAADGHLDNSDDADLLTWAQADSRFFNEDDVIPDTQFSAFGDLEAEGYFGNDADTDLLNRAEADARFFSTNEDIPSSRFDAYDDLVDSCDIEGRGTSCSFVIPNYRLVTVAGGMELFVNEGQGDSITSAMIVNGTIAKADLANDSVTSDQIANGAVRSLEILDNSIASIDILDNTITSADIENNTITNADLAVNSVNAFQIAQNAVRAAEIDDDAVRSNHILDNTITANDMNYYGCGSYVPATSCPGGNNDGPDCREVPPGSFCESDGECSLAELNNCGTYEWYFRRE